MIDVNSADEYIRQTALRHQDDKKKFVFKKTKDDMRAIIMSIMNLDHVGDRS